MMIYPSPLKDGDFVAVTAIASQVSREKIEPGIQILENWGLNVSRGVHLYDRYGSFAGTDTDRLYDLQRALDDPKIKAVFIARGGYGTTRIIDQLGLTSLKKHPKWIIGFSDITALLAHLFVNGFIGLHGPMPGYYASEKSQLSTDQLRSILFGEWLPIQAPANPLNRIGEAKGKILGGNLTILSHLIGTRSDVDTTGSILMLEDIGEQHYAIDRMMVQLKRAGKLNRLAAIVVGCFSRIKDTKPAFGKSPMEIIREHVEEYDYPVAFNFPVGHEYENFPIPIGHPSFLSVREGSGSILSFS